MSFVPPTLMTPVATNRAEASREERREANRKEARDEARKVAENLARPAGDLRPPKPAVDKAKDIRHLKTHLVDKTFLEFSKKEASQEATHVIAESLESHDVSELDHPEIQKAINEEPSPATVQQEGAETSNTDTPANTNKQQQTEWEQGTDLRKTERGDAYKSSQRQESAPFAKSAQQAPQTSKKTPPPATQGAQAANPTPPSPRTPQQPLSRSDVPAPPAAAEGPAAPEGEPAPKHAPTQPGQPKVPDRGTPVGQSQAKPVISKGVQMFAVPNSKGENHPPEMLAEQRALQINYNKLTASVDVPVQAYAAAAGMLVVGQMFTKSSQNRESKVGLSKERDGKGEGTKTADGNERLLKKRMAGIGNTFV